ncbi:aspartate/glutamate racemase family protein [Shewanella sp. OMA3-2]|uniref:aspartate/glutamate racemase family protein n=1 Tax=Shewanella sp. OMA3-2 TaxID=2908650 RepID=UPI001F189A00|nr:aspartate/glutamate racemase family protein [Shewanella sp. OMA3-2]UJF21587.1 aspartate/glutamate racemase family protein [Shewanella sp. OMA3-2]
MRTIGLIGGMSWESTQSYYQVINQSIKQRLGGLHSAKVIIYSVDFAEIAALQTQGDWQGAGRMLADAAHKLALIGADAIVVCTNTMHKVAPQIEASINIPLLHISDATGQKLADNKVVKVGLLGTQFTMEQDFYKTRLTQNFPIELITPNQQDRETIHRIIYQELCLGKTLSGSRKEYLDIIDKLAQQGAQAIILGCTEIGLLVKQTDTSIPLYDTAQIHAEAAVEFMLSK